MVYNPVKSEGQMTRSSVPGDTMVNIPIASMEFEASITDLRRMPDVKGDLEIRFDTAHLLLAEFVQILSQEIRVAG
jgi:hypothetical protein